MNCSDWEVRLALYAGGDLPKDEASQVERHLGECPGCQMFSSGLKESQELLQQLHCEPLAPAHFAAVRARVLAELERRHRPFWRRGWVFGFAAVAAALLLMLAARPGLWPSPKPPVVALEHPPAGSAGGLAAGVFVPAGNIPVGTREPQPTAHYERRPRPKAQPGEPVLIRVVSDNPDVVIYWIADTKGD